MNYSHISTESCQHNPNCPYSHSLHNQARSLKPDQIMILQLFILPFLAELNNGNTIIQPLKARQIAAIHLDGRNPLVVKEGIKRLSQCFIAANEIKPRQPRFFNYNRNTQECTFIMPRNGGFGFWDGPASGEAATVYVDWRMWKPGW